MGLAIVAKLVMHYGGTVCIDSDFSSGTAFRVTLPAASKQDESSRSPESPTKLSHPQWQLDLDGRHAMGRVGRHKSQSLGSERHSR